MKTGKLSHRELTRTKKGATLSRRPVTMPFGITLTIDLRDSYDAVVLADPPVIPS